MDKKDQIILQQLDVIRSMTENNVRRMGSDFWGTPFQDVGKAPTAPGKPAEHTGTHRSGCQRAHGF